MDYKMDARTFALRLKQALRHRLPQFEVRITEDDFPTGVDFLVISPDFEGISHGDRIQFVADVVQFAFGVPLSFRPMGRAITPTEFTQELRSGDADAGALVASSIEGSAARIVE